MLRCRKDGFVCGFSRRARGRAWVVRWVERRAAMVCRFSERPGRDGRGVEERRERVSRIISSVSSAGSGISAAGVECRAADAFVDGGAGEVRGSSSRAVWRMRARVAFRRRCLRSCGSISGGP